MAERSSGDMFERLGPDLSAAVFLYLDNLADLVRSATVSHSWRRFVIANGFCKKFCLRMTPEISCFARAIEVGSLSNTVEVGPNYSGHWQTLEGEHRIFAYLGFCIVSPRFITEISAKSVAASSTADKNENMFSSYWSSEGKSSLTFRLSSKFFVVHEIHIKPVPGVFHFCEPVYLPQTMRFRLGHMMDENATCEELLAGNFIWTYVSPEFPMIKASNFQSFKLPRPVICVCGILQIEILSRDQNSPTDEFFDISSVEVRAIVDHLATPFDVSLDRTGNAVLMYFPGAENYIADAVAVQGPYSSRRKFWKNSKRRRKNHWQS